MKKILIIAVVLVASVSCNTAPKDASDKITSYVMAQDMIKEKFRFPEEVKFEQRDLIHEVDGPGECVLMGAVTAENAFGVRSRYIYKIWLIYSGGEWADSRNWSYSRLIIEDIATGKQETFIGNPKQPYTPPKKADRRKRANDEQQARTKTYRYVEIIDDRDSRTGKIERKEKEPREILAATDSVAYLDAYRWFCAAVKANNHMKELLGGSYTTPVRFKLLNEQGVDISSSVSFATKEQEEKRQEEIAGVTISQK